MHKVTDVYTPDLAKSRLAERFEGNDAILEVVRKLHKTPLCSFAAMCDGYFLSTTGNTAQADFCVNRASAVIHTLKQFHIPVSTHIQNVQSDVGGVAPQAVFFISENDLDKLENDPVKIMRDCESRLQSLKQVHVQKEINRLVKEYGEKELMKLINNASANDNPPDSDEGVG